MGRFRRGLVVGKFAPLHRGHELVIREAQAACDEVVLLSYCHPEPPRCGPEQRRAWLASLFPACRRLVLAADDTRIADWAGGMPRNDAADAEHRDFTARLCLELLGGPVDAVFTSESYGDGFAAHLSRAFSSSVRHVAVDPDRQIVPISGSVLRQDPHAGRDFLSPEVYASFVQRVAILGGESSGKSTLASDLSKSLRTRQASEYGREAWLARDGRLEFDDLLHIAQSQVRREERLIGGASRFLLCDTTPLTTLFYSLELFGRADQELHRLAARTYDRTVLCAADFPFVQDGTRHGGESLRRRQDSWYRAELKRRSIDFYVARGPREVRTAQVLEWLLAEEH